MRGAEDQSLHSVSEVMGEASLRLVAAGDIKLETLSWIEAIRRRHITGGEVMPDIPLGRRAAAYQKLQASVEARDEALTVAEAGERTVERNDHVVAAAADSQKVEGEMQEPDHVVAITDSVIAEEGNQEATVTVNLDNIPGMQTPGEKYVIMFTCKICEERAARKISKKSYHEGVVICRCFKCNNLHLIADRMGVFEDASWDVSMMSLLERDNINIRYEDDIIEVTQDAEEDEEEDEVSESDAATQILIKDLEKELGKDVGSKKN